MKFWEAIKELMDGKKVRRIEWNKGEYLYLDHVKERIQDEKGLQLSCIAGDNIYIWLMAEWGILEEPEKTYSFMEAISLMKEGRKLKRKIWPEGRYLYREGEYIRATLGHAGLWCIYAEDFEANDWIEVK